MAKIQIKSEKLIPFGGIFWVLVGLILFYMVHPIFGVIQAGVYRGGWCLDVRIMDVQFYL